MENQNHRNYGLGKSREESKIEPSVDMIPRAVIRTNEFMLLDGEWNFSPDPENVGIEESWQLNRQHEYKVNWPGSVEEHLKQTTGHPDGWSEQYVVWYERDFPLPKRSSEENAPNCMFQLTFGACGYETMVWINGHPLKTIEGELVHRGEYTSFSYELEDDLLKDSNVLSIRISGSMDAEIPRGKQESRVYKRGGIWYQTFTGPVRSIWIENIERNRLRSRIGVVSNVVDQLVRFTVTSRIHDPGLYRVKLKVYEKGVKGGDCIAQSEYPLFLAAGQKNQRLVLEIPEAKAWSPEHPELYKLIAQLIDSEDRVAEIETDFGLREIASRGNGIYLNGNRVYLNGILYQPATATYDQIRSHVFAIKELGCNLIRIHISGVDPRIYKLADQLGMMLWVEVPSPHSSSETSRENHRNELLRMLALIGTHPSVVIWSLYNEDWGAQDIATNFDTRQYIIDMYHYMQIAQPQFLVIDNDGWQHISYEGRLKSDLLTAHLYTTELSAWQAKLQNIISGNHDHVAAFPLVIGDPYFFRNQVPLVISEWGGFGFPMYGGPVKNTDRAKDILAFKKELRSFPIAGDIYTQATNIEEETNGLIDFETGALKVPKNLLKS